MSLETSERPRTAAKLDRLWFTRCPVPTATGLAYRLGWLNEEFAREGVAVDTLQESSQELKRHHYDHRLPNLIREGGNILALAARAQGEPTRLIGLTWIEEWQAILVRPDSGITQPKDLAGKRLALPAWSENPIPEHVRGTSIARGMSLQGYKGALDFAGLTFDDVELVEVGGGRGASAGTGPAVERSPALAGLWSIASLINGEVDAVYVKGASAVDAAKRLGAVIGIKLDDLPDRAFRVNNGTPRPITVHQSLIDNHFDHLVRFLAQTLKAADWAADNRQKVAEILQSETRGSAEAVEEAYGAGFHTSLHPDLSAGRLDLLDQQKTFLWLHGFIEHDFDIAQWADPRPLAAARELLVRRG